MRLTITFTVLALCTHVPSANAGLHEESQCRFTQVTSRNGLSYNSVKCVMQDSRGYVWIGTYKGLNRYDGTRIKNYGRQDLGVNPTISMFLQKIPPEISLSELTTG